MNKNSNDITELKKMINYIIWTLVPVVAAGFVVYAITQSMAILALVLYQGLNMFVFLFSYASIRIIERSNVISFPYGTGKLENFVSFFIGAITIPACIYIIFTGILRIIHPNFNLSFGLTQLLLVLIISRAIFITLFTKRVSEKTKSPMAIAYYQNFRTGVYFFLGAFAAIFIGWGLIKIGFTKPAAYIDPAIAIVAMSYMFIVSIKQVLGNYRILIDLPLAENEQLIILNALTKEFDSYKNVGNIYTRASGKSRFIDIELYFQSETTLEEIDLLRKKLSNILSENFTDLNFNLIPLVDKKNQGN